MDFLENEEDKGNFSMNPTLISLIHTIVGMILTVFFSIFVTVILRKVVLR
jgi:ABC-type lipoprotein release transport system permease subunit